MAGTAAILLLLGAFAVAVGPWPYSSVETVAERVQESTREIAAFAPKVFAGEATAHATRLSESATGTLGQQAESEGRSSGAEQPGIAWSPWGIPIILSTALLFIGLRAVGARRKPKHKSFWRQLLPSRKADGQGDARSGTHAGVPPNPISSQVSWRQPTDEYW